MTFTFENDIRTDYEGYAKLLRLLHQSENSADTVVIFDFRNVMYFEANLCAVLATIIEILEKKGKKVLLKSFNNEVEMVLRKNAFLLSYGYQAMVDPLDTAILYRKFNSTNKKDDHVFENYIESQLLSKSELAYSCIFCNFDN